jgi:hypothetical protein
MFLQLTSDQRTWISGLSANIRSGLRELISSAKVTVKRKQDTIQDEIAQVGARIQVKRTQVESLQNILSSLGGQINSVVQSARGPLNEQVALTNALATGLLAYSPLDVSQLDSGSKLLVSERDNVSIQRLVDLWSWQYRSLQKARVLLNVEEDKAVVRLQLFDEWLSVLGL